MGAIGLVLKNGIGLTKFIPVNFKNPGEVQQKVLVELLKEAQHTAFGKEYNFPGILKQKDVLKSFQQQVPIHTYGKMNEWWQMTLQGQPSVTWPGKVEYFALSSGTSEGPSKYIPVTSGMLKAMHKASLKQLFSLAHCNLPDIFFEKGNILMLGGSTNLDYNGIYHAGDLSGITTGRIPRWFQPFYKPGKKISSTKDWQQKLNEITEHAREWDIVAIVGVPSWFKLLIERIIERYELNNIHDLWPNLMVFVHGGIAFEPYKKSFEALLGKKLVYLETYLASEGFIAYQSSPLKSGLRMILKNGIFYEYIPFNDMNFDQEGSLKPGATALSFDEAEENKDYALVMSTCAGAWRYLIGDVIRFSSKDKWEIKITGRTKHFLSLTGEHLSVDNMNKAIELLSQQMNVDISEFTVAGIANEKFFAHHWFIAMKGAHDNELKNSLDDILKTLNDDYKVKREMVLEMMVDTVPPEYFVGWLKRQGKEGAQIKFPRVLSKSQYENWLDYLKESREMSAETLSE